MEIGKTFCGRTDGRTDVRTDGRTHLSSNLLGHRRGDDLKTAESSPLTMHSKACAVARPYAACGNRWYHSVPPGGDGLPGGENHHMLSSFLLAVQYCRLCWLFISYSVHVKHSLSYHIVRQTIQHTEYASFPSTAVHPTPVMHWKHQNASYITRQLMPTTF